MSTYNIRLNNYVYVTWSMGGSRKNFRVGGEPSIVGIKVAQFNVLLELQLITLLVISQIPVESANTRVGKSHIWGGTAPSGLLKSAYDLVCKNQTCPHKLHLVGNLSISSVLKQIISFY